MKYLSEYVNQLEGQPAPAKIITEKISNYSCIVLKLLTHFEITFIAERLEDFFV